MVGPFNASLNNKIGEITKYYLNYKFSMELKYNSSQLERGLTQMLEGIVWINNGPIIALYQLAFKTCQVSKTIEHDTTNALFYLWPVLNKNKMYIHFYIEEFNEEYISLKHEASVYLDWHKDFFRNSLHFILKLIILVRV